MLTRQPGWSPAQTPCWTAWLVSGSISLAVITAVQLLPPCQRSAVILRDVPGFHASVAARLLGTTEGSVTSGLRRARPRWGTTSGSSPQRGPAPAARLATERHLVGRAR